MGFFNSLPRELRDMIYTYSLVVDVEIIAYPLPLEIRGEGYTKTKAQYPSPALLAVSKLIRTETIPILYGKNLWRLPHCQDVYGIFYKHQLSFRRVTIVYKQCNLPQNRKLQIKHLVHSISDIEFATGKSVAPHPQGSHKTCMAEMYVLWRESRRTLSGLQGVNEITITLQHFPWASGCLPFLVSEEGWRVLWGNFWTNRFYQWLKGVPADQLRKIAFKGLLNGSDNGLS